MTKDRDRYFRKLKNIQEKLDNHTGAADNPAEAQKESSNLPLHHGSINRKIPKRRDYSSSSTKEGNYQPPVLSRDTEFLSTSPKRAVAKISSGINSVESPGLILIDATSYLLRAFHGLPPMTNSKGQDTGAIYGVINILRSLLNQYNPTHVAVVFDAEGKTFRSDIYAKYRANHPPMPDGLRSQIKPLHNIIRAMGLPIIIELGVEADDVIGTLARQASEKGIHTLISTGDKDMAQLVDKHVKLINTMTNTVLDEAGVVEKFGIPPELIVDFLALKGDKVDNIPGVPGVGDKSALAMLTGIGGITAIYSNLENIAFLDFRGAMMMADKMREYEQQVSISWQLARIKTDTSLTFSHSDLVKYEPDNETLKRLYKELEFKRWFHELKLKGKRAVEFETPSRYSANVTVSITSDNKSDNDFKEKDADKNEYQNTSSDKEEVADITTGEAWLRVFLGYFPFYYFIFDSGEWVYAIVYFITCTWMIPILAFTEGRVMSSNAERVLGKGFLPLMYLYLGLLCLSFVLYVLFGGPRW